MQTQTARPTPLSLRRGLATSTSSFKLFHSHNDVTLVPFWYAACILLKAFSYNFACSRKSFGSHTVW